MVLVFSTRLSLRRSVCHTRLLLLGTPAHIAWLHAARVLCLVSFSLLAAARVNRDQHVVAPAPPLALSVLLILIDYPAI